MSRGCSIVSDCAVCRSFQRQKLSPTRRWDAIQWVLYRASKTQHVTSGSPACEMRVRLLFLPSGVLWFSAAVLSCCGSGVVRLGSRLSQSLSKEKAQAEFSKMTKYQGSCIFWIEAQYLLRVVLFPSSLGTVCLWMVIKRQKFQRFLWRYYITN